MTTSKAIKDAIQKEKSLISGTSTILIENALNRLFLHKNKSDEDRKGLHASALIDSDNHFCLREQVLSLLFKRNKDEKNELPINLIRIFREGDCIHEKWQGMFSNVAIDKGIEDRGYSKKFDLYMTPDAIVELNGKLYVVEIKSMNTFAFKHIKDKHPKGTKQLQLYMHFTGIPRGFVLCEDKNTQEFKVLLYEYNSDIVRPFIERLYRILRGKEKYLSSGKMCKRKCGSSTCKRAMECSMSDACFGKSRIPIYK